MNRRFRKERIHDINYGDGISNVFKSMFNSASKTLASESAKKIAKSAIESVVKAAAEPIGKKSSEVLANKLFNQSSDTKNNVQPIIEEPKVVKDKGNIIEQELKKIYNNKIDKIDKNNEINNIISKKFNELL